MSLEVDIAVIGAGAVGLAIASELAREGVYVLEKNESFGHEASSRNSEVVHAGIYYHEDSLKAKLCLEGNVLLYEFCAKYGVGCKRVEKIFSAVEEDEMEGLEKLYNQARKNGVEGLRLISRDELKKLEPNVEGIAGVLSPPSGIVDSFSYMKTLYNKASEKVNFVFNCEAIGIEKINSKYKVTIRDSEGVSTFTMPILINAAGLHAEKIAVLAGIDIPEAKYKTYLLKGDYFSIRPKKWGLIKRLIYPVPGKVGVGIHNCIAIDGRERLGPDEYYVDEIEYTVDENKKQLFYDYAKNLFPFIEIEDLEPESSGIRPMLQSPGESLKDFVIRHEEDRGFPGLINLIGIESPGLTSSLAIGRYVKGIVEEISG